MENQTAFDLNKAIRSWRDQLEASPALGAADLDELESHVRDSVDALQSRGLSAREAFWVAQDRLGAAQVLDCEFAKRNAEQVWLNRALWMVVGSLVIGFLSGLASTIATLITMAAAYLGSVFDLGFPPLTGSHLAEGTDARALAFNGFSGLAYVLATLGMLAWLWRAGRRNDGWVNRFSARMKAQPVAAGMSVFLLLAFNTVSSFSATLLIATKMGPTQFVMFQPGWTKALVPFLLWPLAVGWLLERTQRRKSVRN